MSCHPAYPTAEFEAFEAYAEARDLADLRQLRAARLAVEGALDRCGLLDAIRHPWVRYSIADTIEALRSELESIAAATREIERELVVGAEDAP